MLLYPLAIKFNKIWKFDQGMVSNETVHLKFLITPHKNLNPHHFLTSKNWSI